MPCRSGDEDQSEQRLRQECNTVTRLLCESLKLLGKDPYWRVDASTELVAWDQRHTEIDLARKEQEQKQQALAQNQAQKEAERAATIKSLTPDQRRILGFNEK